MKSGDTIDRYTIESVLGEGGMGSVYRAHDERLERHVALKVVRVDKDKEPADSDEASRKEATARLMREARAAAKLDHPNAVSIFDVGEIEGTAFIAMELVPGRTVRALISQGDEPVSARVRWLVDVARALSAAHKAGIVHRDVKPENVMVRPDGMVKVLDFGIARRSSHPVDPSAPTETNAMLTLTAAGVPVGTPLYMAPEQIKGEPIDGRTDQFAWGVLAFEVLTGKSPWASKNDALALAAAILTQAPTSIRAACPDVPPLLEEAIVRALSKSPDDRFASMDDLLVSLEGQPAPFSVPTPPTARSISKPPAPAQQEPAMPSSASKRVSEAASEFKRYSADTVRAIIGRALERQASTPHDGYGPDEVLAAAREIGVDDATLRAAARDLAERRAAELMRQDARQRKRRQLLRHVAMYVVVNLFIFLFTNWGLTKLVLMGWGFGLALSAVGYFFPSDDKDKKDKKDKKRGRGREVAELPPPGATAVDERDVAHAVDALLSTTAARYDRLRVATPAGARIASGADHADHDAEAEAAAALGEAPRQARR